MESQMGPPRHHLFIPLTDPGCDLCHPMIIIMTGKLKNHDRLMFAIIAGTTYNKAIPCYQTLPGQLITWPPRVDNRSQSRCPSYEKPG